MCNAISNVRCENRSEMQPVVMKSATLMIAKSSKGYQEKKLRGERERKCGRSFPINADKEIRRKERGGKKENWRLFVQQQSRSRSSK